MDVNEDLLNRTIHHATYIERYKSSVVNRMLAALRLANDQLLELLLQRLMTEEITGIPLAVESTVRIDQQIAVILAQRAQNLQAIGQELKDELRELATYETPFTVGMIDDAIPIQWSLITPPPEQVYAAALARPFQGKLLNEVLDEFTAADSRIIRDTIRAGYLNGLTTQQVIRSLTGTRRLNYEDGAIDASRRAVEAIVRTALQHTANVAREQVFRANREVIGRVQWVSTLDSRTCLIAGSLIKVKNGYKTIESIVKGDIIIGGSGVERLVTATSKSKARKLVKITLSNGNTVTCTIDHLWLTGNGWTEAGLLENGTILESR